MRRASLAAVCCDVVNYFACIRFLWTNSSGVASVNCNTSPFDRLAKEQARSFVIAIVCLRKKKKKEATLLKREKRFFRLCKQEECLLNIWLVPEIHWRRTTEIGLGGCVAKMQRRPTCANEVSDSATARLSCLLSCRVR